MALFFISNEHDTKQDWKNQSSRTLAQLIGDGSQLASILIVVCFYSLHGLVLYTRLWIIAQVHEHRIRLFLSENGIVSFFYLCRKHKKKVAEYIETLNEPKFVYLTSPHRIAPL